MAGGGGPALEGGEQGLPSLVDTPLGRVENGKVVPRLRHRGMVPAEPVEDLDGFLHPSLLRVQDPVQQSEPGMIGIACEQRIEHPPRFRKPVFGGERDDSFKVFIDGCGRGRKDRRQHAEREQALLHRPIEPHNRLPGNPTGR